MYKNEIVYSLRFDDALLRNLFSFLHAYKIVFQRFVSLELGQAIRDLDSFVIFSVLHSTSSKDVHKNLSKRNLRS